MHTLSWTMQNCFQLFHYTIGKWKNYNKENPSPIKIYNGRTTYKLKKWQNTSTGSWGLQDQSNVNLVWKFAKGGNLLLNVSKKMKKRRRFPLNSAYDIVLVYDYQVFSDWQAKSLSLCVRKYSSLLELGDNHLIFISSLNVGRGE